MNALHVTVSISLLLVLAGFNHAYGLTTFGKSNNQGQQPVVQGKHCTQQADCNLIKGTTCLKSYCFCGDNTYPLNGICNAKLKGAKHVCQSDEECVDGAICSESKETTKPANPPSSSSVTYKTCQCQEGYTETAAGICSGGTNLAMLPGLLLLCMALAKVY